MENIRKINKFLRFGNSFVIFTLLTLIFDPGDLQTDTNLPALKACTHVS